MEIKNFSYLRSVNKVIKVFALLGFLFVTNCQMVSKRNGNGSAAGTETSNSSSAESATNMELIKIGVILGPGSAKTFAHLGVLESLEKAKIPIHALVGLEWGSLMAASYSAQGKAYDAQWKVMKMRESDLPHGGLLNSTQEMGAPQSMDKFLRTIFNELSVQQLSKPFACPVKSTQTGKVQMLAQGVVRDVITTCMAYPPYFYSHSEWAGAPSALQEAIDYLHSVGATKIVYVDVLSQSSLMTEKAMREHFPLYQLWFDQQEHLAELQSRVDDVILVKTGRVGLTYFDQRRGLVEVGQVAGKAGARRLSQKYGF